MSMLRDAHEADDALQQTFLSAYRSLLGGSVPRDAEAWVVTIARNECRARIRDRMATPLADVEVETFAGARRRSRRGGGARAARGGARGGRRAAGAGAAGGRPPGLRRRVERGGGRAARDDGVRRRVDPRARAGELRARAWPVLAGARALVLAPASWVRALLFAPGGTDVVAVAKVGTAMAVVGTLVTVGPSVGSHGNPARGPAPAGAAVVAAGGSAAHVSALDAVVARARPTLLAHVVGGGTQRGTVHPVAAPPPVVAHRSPETHDDAHGAAAGAGTATARGRRPATTAARPRGPSPTSGPSGDSGSGETSSSGSGSGAASTAPARRESSGSGSGTDDGPSSETSGSGTGSSGDGTGSSDGGSSGSGAGDGASDERRVRIGLRLGRRDLRIGIRPGSSGSGSSTSGESGSGGGSGGSGDPGTTHDRRRRRAPLGLPFQGRRRTLR